MNGMIEFTDEEIETIKNLIEDHGFEYSLKSKLTDILKIANKLEMTNYVKVYKEFL